MKLLLALSTLLAITAAEPTCEDCTAVVTTIATYLTTEESIGNQVEVLVAEVCPQSVDPDACVAGVPDLGTRLKFWWLKSVHNLWTLMHVWLGCQTSGPGLLMFSGLDTGTLRQTGCVQVKDHVGLKRRTMW